MGFSGYKSDGVMFSKTLLSRLTVLTSVPYTPFLQSETDLTRILIAAFFILRPIII